MHIFVTEYVVFMPAYAIYSYHSVLYSCHCFVISSDIMRFSWQCIYVESASHHERKQSCRVHLHMNQASLLLLSIILLNTIAYKWWLIHFLLFACYLTYDHWITSLTLGSEAHSTTILSCITLSVLSTFINVSFWLPDDNQQ